MRLKRRLPLKKKNNKENRVKHDVLKKFMALAFLPSHMIIRAFNFLIEECRRDHESYFDTFIIYFDDEWITKVKPEG